MTQWLSDQRLKKLELLFATKKQDCCHPDFVGAGLRWRESVMLAVWDLITQPRSADSGATTDPAVGTPALPTLTQKILRELQSYILSSGDCRTACLRVGGVSKLIVPLCPACPLPPILTWLLSFHRGSQGGSQGRGWCWPFCQITFKRPQSQSAAPGKLGGEENTAIKSETTKHGEEEECKSFPGQAFICSPAGNYQVLALCRASTSCWLAVSAGSVSVTNSNHGSDQLEISAGKHPVWQVSNNCNYPAPALTDHQEQISCLHSSLAWT